MNKTGLLKKIRPFSGLIFFLFLILISTVLVFFSVTSLLLYPLLWVVFMTLNFFNPQKRSITHCLNAIRSAMWAYYVAFFLFLLWTPKWMISLSQYLERKTWWNVFKEGSYMCGRTATCFVLSLVVLTGFWLHYRLTYNKKDKLF